MKSAINKKWFRNLGMAALTLIAFCGMPHKASAQLLKPFTQRSSTYTPGKVIYNIKGDFTMIGNTNLTLEDYSDSEPNSNNEMVYVDVDGDASTLNSSSATLQLSTENDAIPECSNIIYAGLYWTGRAHDGGDSPNSFLVGGTTNNYQDNVSINGYTLTIGSSGSDPRIATYTFTPTTGDPVVFTLSSNNDETVNSLNVKVGTGTSVPVSYTRTASNSGSGEDYVEVTLNSPYTINSGSTSITVNRLRMSTDNNTLDGTFYANVSYGGKTLNKLQVKLKHASESSYTPVTANANDIYYPSNAYGNMYSAYAEVTDYVKAHGIGNYFVADMALREGDGGSTGYYGGWGMIVVYENSKMKWRDVTIFDGHAYVAGGTTVSYQLPVSGFRAVKSGPVNLKLGLMAGEGDRTISGDYFDIIDQSSNWVRLSHSENTTSNFFNSSVNTGTNPMNPNLVNNTGLDMAMFDIPNTNNSIITNNQTSTTFRYGSTQDTYILFCMAMAVDAYVPDPEGNNGITEIGNVTIVPGEPIGNVLPGQEIEYTLEIRNKGTEPINDMFVSIPIPYTTSYISSSAVYYAGLSGPQAVYNPSAGATGSLEWAVGDVPLPDDANTLLAKLTYTLKVTEDCFILSNENCTPKVTVLGYIDGVGATSGTIFSDRPFIQGYEMEGICAGEPITDPLAITIDGSAYVNQECTDQDYSTRAFTYCNVPGTTIPFTDVFGFFPPGSRFYSDIDESTGDPLAGATEYTSSTGFPATPGLLTYLSFASDFTPLA